MFDSTIQHDRKLRMQVALALFATIALAGLKVFNIATGRIWEGRWWILLAIAVFCFAGMAHLWKQTPLRAACILIGAQAATRAFLGWEHAARGLLYLANLFGELVSLLGLIIIIVFILNWFNSVRPDQSSSGGGNIKP